MSEKGEVKGFLRVAVQAIVSGMLGAWTSCLILSQDLRAQTLQVLDKNRFLKTFNFCQLFKENWYRF